MKTFQILTAVASLGAMLAISNRSEAVTFGATSTLVSPTSNQQFHTGGAGAMSITVTGSGIAVTIDGASANQSFNVQWTIDLEIDGSSLFGSMDFNSGIVTCNALGHYDHSDNASLSVSAMCTANTNHTATAYVDFLDNNNLSNKANQRPTNTFHVISP
jgi:hypothetical protein